jgi:hypothetical protein
MLHTVSPSRRRRLPPLPRRTRSQNAVTIGAWQFTFQGRSYIHILEVCTRVLAVFRQALRHGSLRVPAEGEPPGALESRRSVKVPTKSVSGSSKVHPTVPANGTDTYLACSTKREVE